MWNKKLISLAWVFGLLLVLSSCSSGKRTTFTGAGDASGNCNNNNSSSANYITAFSIDNKMGVINGADITVEIPASDVDIADLTPTIENSAKASVSPASGVARDFTNPVTYTVTAADGSTKVYTAKVVLTYKLRDAGPAGGLIFYDKGSYSDGWRYLEAAPSDQSTSAGTTWSNITNVAVPGGTGTVIDAGKINTANIIAQPNHTSSAAKLCSSQTIGLHTDWFLPSKDQLNKMYINLKSGTDENGSYTAVGNFSHNPAGDGPYWSSSENNASTAYYQNFSAGTLSAGLSYAAYKYGSAYSRCIRSF
jgi:hypothetical protein